MFRTFDPTVSIDLDQIIAVISGLTQSTIFCRQGTQIVVDRKIGAQIIQAKQEHEAKLLMLTSVKPATPPAQNQDGYETLVALNEQRGTHK